MPEITLHPTCGNPKPCFRSANGRPRAAMPNLPTRLCARTAPYVPCPPAPSPRKTHRPAAGTSLLAHAASASTELTTRAWTGAPQAGTVLSARPDRRPEWPPGLIAVPAGPAGMIAGARHGRVFVGHHRADVVTHIAPAR